MRTKALRLEDDEYRVHWWAPLRTSEAGKGEGGAGSKGQQEVHLGQGLKAVMY